MIDMLEILLYEPKYGTLDLEELRPMAIECARKNFLSPDYKSLFPRAICQSLLKALKECGHSIPKHFHQSLYS